MRRAAAGEPGATGTRSKSRTRALGSLWRQRDRGRAASPRPRPPTAHGSSSASDPDSMAPDWASAHGAANSTATAISPARARSEIRTINS